MAVAELVKNMSVDTPILIFINNDTDIFLLNSYVRGYHAYMDVWTAIINDFVHCKRKRTMNSILQLVPLLVMPA